MYATLENFNVTIINEPSSPIEIYKDLAETFNR